MIAPDRVPDVPWTPAWSAAHPLSRAEHLAWHWRRAVATSWGAPQPLADWIAAVAPFWVEVAPDWTRQAGVPPIHALAALAATHHWPPPPAPRREPPPVRAALWQAFVEAAVPRRFARSWGGMLHVAWAHPETATAWRLAVTGPTGPRHDVWPEAVARAVWAADTAGTVWTADALYGLVAGVREEIEAIDRLSEWSAAAWSVKLPSVARRTAAEAWETVQLPGGLAAPRELEALLWSTLARFTTAVAYEGRTLAWAFASAALREARRADADQPGRGAPWVATARACREAPWIAVAWGCAQQVPWLATPEDLAAAPAMPWAVLADTPGLVATWLVRHPVFAARRGAGRRTAGGATGGARAAAPGLALDPSLWATALLTPSLLDRARLLAYLGQSPDPVAS